LHEEIASKSSALFSGTPEYAEQNFHFCFGKYHRTDYSHVPFAFTDNILWQSLRNEIQQPSRAYGTFEESPRNVPNIVGALVETSCSVELTPF